MIGRLRIRDLLGYILYIDIHLCDLVALEHNDNPLSCILGKRMVKVMIQVDLVVHHAAVYTICENAIYNP